MPDGGAIKLRTVLKRDPVPATPSPADAPSRRRSRRVSQVSNRPGFFGRLLGRTSKQPRTGGSKAFSAIRNRFLAVNLPLVLIAVLGLYGVSEWMVNQFSYSSLRSELHRMSDRIAQAVETPVLLGQKAQVANVIEGAAANSDVRGILVQDRAGRPLASLGDVFGKGPASLRHTVTIRLVTAGQARKIGTLTVALTDDRLNRATDARRRIVAIIALLLAMVAVVIGMVVQDTTVRVPLKKLNEAIRMREATGKMAQIDWSSTDEPGEVIRAFNELQQREDMYVSALRASKARMEQRIQERDAELAAARGEAATAIESTRSLATGFSHRFRTPLTNIIGFADMIARERLGPVDSRYKRYGEYIGESGRSLMEVIDDVLVYTEVEKGALHLTEQDLTVRDLIDGCVRRVTPAAEARGHRLTMVDIPDVTIRGDRDKLDQVLLKLLSNAVVHTADGGRVEVLCETRRDGLRIHVTDNGPGIPLEAQDRIFEPYARISADKEGGKDEGGTGLGLSLARSLVEMHNGRLQVYSKPGRGTCMTVILPAERVISQSAG